MGAALRAAWARWFGGPASGAPTCPRCAELTARVAALTADVAYWRGREERTLEALLTRDVGVVGVAREPKGPTRGGLTGAMAALNVTSITTKPSSQPGQGQMSERA